MCVGPIFLDQRNPFDRVRPVHNRVFGAQTRYVMKYRHCDDKIVLKVTNDRTVLQFQTDQASDVKRLDKLNGVFLTRMCGKEPNKDAAEGEFRTLLAAVYPPSPCPHGQMKWAVRRAGPVWPASWGLPCSFSSH